MSSVFQMARISGGGIGFNSNSIPAPGNGGAGLGVRSFTINSRETAAYITQACPAPCSKPVLDVVNLTNGIVIQQFATRRLCLKLLPQHVQSQHCDEPGRAETLRDRLYQQRRVCGQYCWAEHIVPTNGQHGSPTP